MRFSIFAVVVVFVLASRTPAEVMYTLTDLGTLGGSHSRGCAVNESGQVVGHSQPAQSSAYHASLWSDGTWTDLGTLGASQSWARGINNSSQVIYDVDTSNGFTRSFIWSNGIATELQTGYTYVSSRGINNSGQVVGYSEWGNDAIERAFLWSNGGTTELGTLGGQSSCAFGVNDSGQVVGWSHHSMQSGRPHAFLWQGGEMSDLGILPGGVDSRATAISNTGAVVGWSSTSNVGANNHPFLWEAGIMTDLGTLGGSDSRAYDINSSRQVVGMSNGSPFLWSDGIMKDLNSLIDPNSGWELWGVEGINDAGQIVGYGKTPDNKAHAFLLNPVAEPSSILLFVLGAFAVLRKR